MDAFSPFAAYKYVQLVTFRKNGTPVGTPMWFAVDATGWLYMQTNAASAKIKRIRNQTEVEISPCDRRGKRIAGPTWRGRATVHAANSTVADKSIRLLKFHYGWVFRIFNFFLKVFRRKLVYLEIQLDSSL